MPNKLSPQRSVVVFPVPEFPKARGILTFLTLSDNGELKLHQKLLKQ